MYQTLWKLVGEELGQDFFPLQEAFPDPVCYLKVWFFKEFQQGFPSPFCRGLVSEAPLKSVAQRLCFRQNIRATPVISVLTPQGHTLNAISVLLWLLETTSHANPVLAAEL